MLRLREEAVERAKDQLAVEMVQMNQAQQQVDEVNARIGQAREAFRESMSNGTRFPVRCTTSPIHGIFGDERENRQMTLEGYQARVEAVEKLCSQRDAS